MKYASLLKGIAHKVSYYYIFVSKILNVEIIETPTIVVLSKKIEQSSNILSLLKGNIWILGIKIEA